MKLSTLLPSLGFIIFSIAACKKTGTTENPQPVADDIIGTWHVKNYVVATLPTANRTILYWQRIMKYLHLQKTVYLQTPGLLLTTITQ
jgi:hypothetical protein